MLVFVREGVNFACLPALAGCLAFAHPAAFHEPPKKRIDQIVVHLAFARNEAHLLLERIPALGAAKKVGQASEFTTLN